MKLANLIAGALLFGGIQSFAQTANQKLFSTQKPAQKNLSDGARVNYELGMRFSATAAGKVKAIRFFKASREKGTHTGRIFSASGQQLASVTFKNETSSGWQQQALPTPLSIAANAEYVVSVNTANTYYVATTGGLASAIVSGNLRSAAGNNGVFGPVGKKPSSSWQNSNYFRDVVYAADAVTPPPPPPPDPDPTPTPDPDPVPSTDLPSSSNTGWRHTGVTLKPMAGMTISADGTVIDGKDINGQIDIRASNVTIRRSRVHSTSSYFPIHIISGSNIVIEDVEVDGGGFSSKAIYVESGAVTMRRLDLHDSEDGIHISGQGPVYVRDSFIHSPRHAPEGHSDGLEIESAHNVFILHNNLDYRNATTSATMIDNYFGSVSNLVFDGNRLAGGAYAMYLDGRFNSSQLSNIQVTNSRWVANTAAYGPILAAGALAQICWANNAYEGTNTVIAYGGSAQVACPSSTATQPPPPPPTASADCVKDVWSNLETCGWPGPKNTGWQPTGVALKPSGSLTITTAGTVVDGLDVSGTIYINAPNVTIKRSRVRAAAFALIQIRAGTTGVRVEDCELNGLGGGTNSMGVIGPATVLRSNIYGVENGITPTSGSLAQDNYIHDLKAAGAPHYDNFQLDGGIANVTIRHNTVSLKESQTSAVMIDNYFGAIDNILVDNNLFAGGGFTMYVDNSATANTITNVRHTNNKFSNALFPCVGYWGVWYPRGMATDGWHRSGNMLLETNFNLDNGNPSVNGRLCN